MVQTIGRQRPWMQAAGLLTGSFEHAVSVKAVPFELQVDSTDESFGLHCVVKAVQIGVEQTAFEASVVSGSQAVGQTVRVKGQALRVIGVLATKGGGGFGSVDDGLLVPLSTSQRKLFGGRAVQGGATLVSTIVGPTGVAGASNSDPQFVDRAGHDYHIAPTSPAKDAVDSGPAFDFEGDPRPRGARFDIGADETQ